MIEYITLHSLYPWQRTLAIILSEGQHDTMGERDDPLGRSIDVPRFRETFSVAWVRSSDPVDLLSQSLLSLGIAARLFAWLSFTRLRSNGTASSIERPARMITRHHSMDRSNVSFVKS